MGKRDSGAYGCGVILIVLFFGVLMFRGLVMNCDEGQGTCDPIWVKHSKPDICGRPNYELDEYQRAQCAAAWRENH